MDCRIVIEPDNYVEEFGFGDSVGKLKEFTVDACLLSYQELCISPSGCVLTSSAAFSFMRTYVAGKE